jgi:hypothetical protein
VRPHANAEWWREKLSKNARRDRDTNERLEALGWCVLRFWEHESAKSVVRKIATAVRGIRSDGLNSGLSHAGSRERQGGSLGVPQIGRVELPCAEGRFLKVSEPRPKYDRDKGEEGR